MESDPARGFPICHEKNPRRPMITQDRFERLRAAGQDLRIVDSRGLVRRERATCLPELLDLANGTGRRISAILALRWCDLTLDWGKHGAICWPAETDKLGREGFVPMNATVRSAIDQIAKQRPGIGPSFLFPAIHDGSRPLRVEVASEWLVRAEKLAGLEPQRGTLWHALRRKWATERKHLPLADVAEAGGWSSQQTLTDVYQKADAIGMQDAVDGAIPLREPDRENGDGDEPGAAAAVS